MAQLTLSDLNPDLLGRLEENVESGPVFWSQVDELYPLMVEAMNEAALVTGLVQQNNVYVELPANTTYFSLQNNSAIGVPAGVFAALRMRAPWTIRKTTIKALDNYDPKWQQAKAASQIISWFPLGSSYFGIYPQLDQATRVVMDFLTCPVTKVRPYDGTESVPFQDEFTDLIPQYAAAMARTKEGGVEAETAADVFKQYLTRMKAVSQFSERVDSLVFSGSLGGQNRVGSKTVT